MIKYKKHIEPIIRYYYPFKISFNNDFERYVSTAQFQRLEAAIKKHLLNKAYWDETINLMNENLGSKFTSIMPNHLDRCISYQANLPEFKDMSLQLDICALSDFFTLFVLERRFTENTELDNKSSIVQRLMSNNQSLRYERKFNFEEFDLVQTVGETKGFLEDKSKLKFLSSELLKINLPDYYFDSQNSLTVYDALFSSSSIMI